MRKSSILKIALLILVLALSGCRTVEDAPPHWLCQFNGNPRAFYCVHSKTGSRLKVAADVSTMKAAQCLSSEDYRAMQNYIDYLIDEAQRRCR